MRIRSHRLLTVLILLGWIGPQSTAFGWSLHLALEGHGGRHQYTSEAGDHHHEAASHEAGAHREPAHHTDDDCGHIAHRVGLAVLAETLVHGHSHGRSDRHSHGHSDHHSHGQSYGHSHGHSDRHSNEDSEATPDHEHEATAKGSTGTSGKLPTLAFRLQLVPPVLLTETERGFESLLRRGPPPPLFTTHCSLLL